MKKGIYLVPHGGNFSNKEGKIIIGSSTHINKGIECLSEYYVISSFIINEIKSDQGKNSYKAPVLGKVKWGALRDIKSLLVNSYGFFKVYRHLKKVKPDFIYERSEYLNFSGVIAARMLGIKHFYEANWIHYLGIKQFYDSALNNLARKAEEWMYGLSNHVFFVGNQNKLLTLKKQNYSVIQNGVDEQTILTFADHQNTIRNKIEVCVLASLMVHHRFDILLESLNFIVKKDQIRLHIIGVNFESQLNKIPEGIEYVYHGPVAKKELYQLLSQMNLAIISGGPFYSSFMKLYDYAAMKLGVICPSLENITNTFSADEIHYFDVDNYTSLAEKFNYLIDNPDEIVFLGENLYKKVAANFTWQKIFERISKQIEKEYTN